MYEEFLKDPDAVLDFVYDWAPYTNSSKLTDWLAASETIVSTVITPETGITEDSNSITDSGTTVTAWLSGGTDGSDYNVACAIVTSDGREDERTITVVVRER